MAREADVFYILIMWSKFRRKFTAQLVFIVGLSLMILGISFLLWSMEGNSLLFIFLAFFLVVLGALCAVFAIRLNKKLSYLFFASFFMMTGIYLLLSVLGIISLPVFRAWPMLSIFSGLALLPVGWKRCGGFNTRYFVSSCAFIALGCILMVFSFRVVPFSFSQFIREWWPMLFILGGITLILMSLVAGSSHNNRSSGDKNTGKKHGNTPLVNSSGKDTEKKSAQRQE